MLLEFKDIPETGLHPADIVVGSGAIGLYLAAEVAKSGLNVILVEAGSRALGGFDSQSFENTGRKHDGIRISRSKSLGGTTNLWGGQLVEFMPCDFVPRPRVKTPGWPISYDDVASHYTETYKRLGVPESALTDAATWRYVHFEPPQLPRDMEVFLTRWMRVPNLAELYADVIQNHPNLRVITGCAAVDFEYSDQQVNCLIIRNGAGAEERIRARRIILAAGTLENARLLLNAQASASCPWRKNHNIGLRFQDHLGGRIGSVTPLKSNDFYKTFSTLVVRGAKFQPKVRWSNTRVLRDERLNIQAMFSFESSISENLVFLKQFVKAALYRRHVGSIRGLIANALACSYHLPPLMWRYLVQHRILVPSRSKISIHLQSETIPIGASAIRIDRSKVDRYGLPKLLLDWRIDGGEFEDIHSFSTELRDSLKQAGLGNLTLDEQLDRGDRQFLDTLYDTGHQTGGCVMGISDESSVVDKNLMVFGTNNLYVAGACVFPTCSNANVTFTAMALATRLRHQLIKLEASHARD